MIYIIVDYSRNESRVLSNLTETHLNIIRNNSKRYTVFKIEGNTTYRLVLKTAWEIVSMSEGLNNVNMD